MAKRSSKRRRREARARMLADGGSPQSPNVRAKKRPSPREQPGSPEIIETTETFRCEITTEPLPSPEIDQLPEKLRDRIPEIYDAVLSDPAAMIDEVRVLTIRHPEVDSFQNWLCTCYRGVGENARARRLAERIVEERPGYFFGRITLAEICLEEGDLESADRLLGPVRHPRALFPERTVFHVTEIRHYLLVTGKFHIMTGAIDEARNCHDLLNRIEPGTAAVEELDRLLEPENAAKLAMIGLFRNLLDPAEGRDFRHGPPQRRKSKRRSRKPPPEPAAAAQGELFALEELIA